MILGKMVDKKGQGFMEFLAIYGWSLVVGTVAVGSLFLYMDVDKSSVLTESCLMGPGLKCSDFTVTEDKITLVVINSMGKDLGTFYFSTPVCLDSANKQLKNGEQKVFIAEGCSLNEGYLFDSSLVAYYSFVGSNIVHKRDFSLHAKIEPGAGLCGNGITDPGEQCDDGSSNGDLCVPSYGGSCGYCGTNCQNQVVNGGYCDDNIKNGPEECDNGTIENGNVCVPSYGESCVYCDNSCNEQIVNGGSCGDFVCDPEESCSICFEDCDLPGGACCGDNSVDGTEQCDDGINNGQVCTVPNGYNQQCVYCETNCMDQTVFGPYCGDLTCQNVAQFIVKGTPAIFDLYGNTLNVNLINVAGGAASFRINGQATGPLFPGQTAFAGGNQIYVVDINDEPDNANALFGENSIVCVDC